MRHHVSAPLDKQDQARRRRRNLAGSVCASLLLLLACAPHDMTEVERDEPLGTAYAALSPDPACATAPRARLMTGPGQWVTPDANYGHSTCARGYLVDFDRYPTNTNSIVAYAGAVPTNQFDCERSQVAAYVWHRTSSGSTFIGSATASGTWGPDIRGVNHCAPPVMNIEKAIPGFRGDGTKNYRIGLRARLRDVANNNDVYQKFGFATADVTPQTAKGLLQDLLDLGARARSEQLSGVMNPIIQSVFSRKGRYAVDVHCRQLQLERAVVRFGRQALLRAGGSPGGTLEMTGGLDQMSTGLCTSAGTIDDLRTGLLRYIAGIDATRATIRTRLSNAPDPDQLTAATIGGVFEQAYGLLGANCGLNPDALLGYLYDGALPTGITADQLIFGSCRSLAPDPAGIAAALGFGSPFGGESDATARNKFQACMADSAGTDRCNDPRAQDAPAATPATTQDKCWIKAENRACNATEQAAYDKGKEDEKKARATGNQMQVQGNQTAPTPPNPAAAQTGVTWFGQMIDGAWGLLTYATIPAGAWAASQNIFFDGTTLRYIATGAELTTLEGALLASAWFAAYVIPTKYGIEQCIASAACHEAVKRNCVDTLGGPQVCPDHRPGPGNQYCGSEFENVGGFYETDGPPGQTNQFTKADRFNHCMCEFLDDSYSGVTGASGFAPLGCPTKAERKRQDCLQNPIDELGRPRRECLSLLSPPGDVRVWQTRLCEKINCGQGLIKQTSADGSCACVQPPPSDPAKGLPCTAGTRQFCDDLGVTQCTCLPNDSGSAPMGDNPFCAYRMDAASWPGSLDAFMVRNVGDATVHKQDANNRFVMIKPTQSAVSPIMYRNSLPAVPAPGGASPAKWRVKALVSRAPIGSSNIDLQMYVTSFGLPAGKQPLTHDFMGQVRLNNLPAGVPTDVDIPLNQNLIERAFSGTGWRVEYTVQTPVEYARFVGVGPQALIGTTIATPIASRAPDCPRPAPDNGFVLVTAPNPTFLTTPPSEGSPVPVFPLASGWTATIPPYLIELIPRD
jgi:hypothetical protein